LTILRSTTPFDSVETPTITSSAERSQFRLALNACCNSRSISFGYLGCYQESLLPSSVANPLKPEREFLPIGGYVSAGPDEQASLLLFTEHFGYDEDEYGSAKATAQEQIQQ
jgi:hypothetical protein